MPPATVLTAPVVRRPVIALMLLVLLCCCACRYRTTARIWDQKEREILQVVDLGSKAKVGAHCAVLQAALAVRMARCGSSPALSPLVSAVTSCDNCTGCTDFPIKPTTSLRKRPPLCCDSSSSQP